MLSIMRFVYGLAALVASASAQSTTNLTAALTGNSNLSALTALISNNTALVQALSSATNVTILAPSNDAIQKFSNSTGASSILTNTQVLQAVIQYHVLNGTYNSSQITNTSFVPTHLTSPLLTNVTGGQRVEAVNSSGTVQFISGLLSASNVTTADVAYNNGIIHIIDTILTPPANISETAIQLNLSSVAGALTKANLVSTIDTARDLTVFAPNNVAFQAVGSVIDAASPEALASVLGYHVVNGSVLYSTLIQNGSSVQTLNGANLTVTINNGSVYVNQAKVIIANALVANGVVHVIDSVLNPNASSAAPGNSSVFPGASSVSSGVLTSGVPSGTRSVSVPAQATATTSSSSAGVIGQAQAMATGAIGAGMLFAGAILAL